MCLTREVDLKLLNKCFEIETYDCLLKPEYIDAIRARRQHLRAMEERKAENKRIAERRLLKENTMRCNAIANRIRLQEHFLAMQGEEEILKQLEDIIGKEDDNKKYFIENVQELFFNHVLEGFEIENPTDYFKDHPENVDLVCSVQTKFEFLISVLEIYGLPKGYMTGVGHHNDWSKDAQDKKKKGGKAKKTKTN